MCAERMVVWGGNGVLFFWWEGVFQVRKGFSDGLGFFLLLGGLKQGTVK